jgi:hypothetical protein
MELTAQKKIAAIRSFEQLDIATAVATAQLKKFFVEQEQFNREASAKMRATIQALNSIRQPSVLPKIDFKALGNQMILGQKKLAETGWTVVGWIDLPHARAFRNWSESEIDAYFETQYLRGPENRLKHLRRKLLKDSSFAPWRDLLRESFRAFNQGLHKICVPSLVSVLEGYAILRLVETAEGNRKDHFQRDTAPQRGLRGLRRHNNQHVKGMIWQSLVEFFDNLYKHSDFCSDRPTFLNRHWIQHGRSESDWTKLDALRLFNALDTLHWACEDLNKNQKR